MAIVKGALQMTGSVGEFSFYTVRGSDKIIVRTKGGASKAKIKTSPKFAGLRKQQKEWGGCAKFGSVTRYSFGGLHRIADYNLNPVLNGMGKSLMKLDTVSEVGQRHLKLSSYRRALDGFNFNRNYPFNTVLKILPTVHLNREKLEATIQLPSINTDIDLLNVQRLPFFRIIAAMGVVSDLLCDAETNDYIPFVPELHGISEVRTGTWNSTQTVLAEQTLSLAMGQAEIDLLSENVTIIISLGVEFGNVGFTGEPVAVKYAGSGKVLKVG